MIKIVVDLMGADKPARELLLGAINAINSNSDLFIYVCAKKEEIKDILDSLEYNRSQLELIDCGEPITNYDVPTIGFKTKTDSSLIKGLTICKNDPTVSGFVSCGSTGAILASSIFILGRIGKVRPALSPILPGVNKDFCLVDCGANSDCRPQQLLEFAKMGVAYMQANGVEIPKVALLSNGIESKKGNEIVKETHNLLAESNLNFIGNVEGKNLLSSDADVIVCDGFTGNIALKTIEGTAQAIIHDMITIAKKSGSHLVSDAIKAMADSLARTYDYNILGGAVLLGVNKLVIKGHGAAVAETVNAIITDAYKLAKNDLTNKLKSLLEE